MSTHGRRWSAAARRLLRAGACVASLVGCGVDEPAAPVARITASPGWLPVDDAYRTDLLLDGSASEDPADPTRAAPLAFRWSVDDPAPRVVAGALDAARVTVRLAAAAPTRVSLTVSVARGAASTATRYVGVTLPAR